MSLYKSDNKVSSVMPWFIWGLAATFYAYEFFLQVSPSVMVPELMSHFNLDAGSLGNLVALYIYSYAIMQVPAGLFLDIIGPRRLLVSASAICAIGALLFGIADHVWVAKLGRLLIGFGSAFAAIGTFKLVSIWFPMNRFAFLTGLTVAVGMAGAVIGSAPLAILVGYVGWQTTLLILAGIGICISLLIWLVVRDSPNYFKSNCDDNNTPQTGLLKSLLFIFKKPQCWLTAAYGGLMFAPTTTFAGLWGTPFLLAKYGISRPLTAAAVSMIFIGWAVGSPLMGLLSDYIKRRKPTLYLAAIGAMISMLIIIYTTLPLLLLFIMLFLFGLFSSGFLPSFSIIRESTPSNANATALGFMNMLNMIGGAIMQPLIGFLLDVFWKGQMHLNIRIYSIHAYHIALLLLPLCLLGALLIAPFIRETNCLPLEEDTTANHQLNMECSHN